MARAAILLGLVLALGGLSGCGSDNKSKSSKKKASSLLPDGVYAGSCQKNEVEEYNSDTDDWEPNGEVTYEQDIKVSKDGKLTDGMIEYTGKDCTGEVKDAWYWEVADMKESAGGYTVTSVDEWDGKKETEISQYEMVKLSSVRVYISLIALTVLDEDGKKDQDASFDNVISYPDLLALSQGQLNDRLKGVLRKAGADISDIDMDETQAFANEAIERNTHVKLSGKKAETVLSHIITESHPQYEDASVEDATEEEQGEESDSNADGSEVN